MNVNPNSSQDTKRHIRVVFFIVLLWIALNHTIKFAASGSGIVLLDTQSKLGGSVGMRALHSVDKFRSETGHVFYSISRFCPKSVYNGCESTVRSMQTVFGLN